MAKGSNYRVQLRRRREGKTDYQARKAMVISRKPRLVARTSIKNASAQIVIAKLTGDQVLAAANSRELVTKYDWKAPTGNIPAAYLTGLLCGLKAKTAGVEQAILDLGLTNPTKGARVFALLNGVVDAGVEIPHGEGKIVKERTKGNHIASYAKSLSGEKAPPKFSKYNAQGISPEKVVDHFSQVKNNILGAFKAAKVSPEPISASEAKSKAAKPSAEAKVAPVPKAEAKVAPKLPSPQPEVKAEQPKTQVAPAPKKEVPAAKAAKLKAPKKETPTVSQAAKRKAAKEKAPKAEKSAVEGKVAEQTPKEKSKPKAAAKPRKKAAIKGEKKE